MEIPNKSPKDEVGSLLNEIYYTPGLPSSFSSPKTLYNEAKKVLPTITMKIVKQFLEKQYVYSRHKKLNWKFPRRKVLSLRIDQTWAADLIGKNH